MRAHIRVQQGAALPRNWGMLQEMRRQIIRQDFAGCSAAMLAVVVPPLAI